MYFLRLRKMRNTMLTRASENKVGKETAAREDTTQTVVDADKPARESRPAPYLPVKPAAAH